jgi:hypothetical protein
LTVLSALKETVSPDFVLNFTVVGFFTVLIAANLTFFEAIFKYIITAQRASKTDVTFAREAGPAVPSVP